MSPRLAALLAALAGVPAAAASGPPATPAAAASRGPQATTPRAIAERELARLVKEDRASRAAIVILEPGTGRVLALAGAGPEGDLQPLRAVETGSTMKTFTVAAGLEGGLDPARRFTGEGGRWQVGGVTLSDVSASDWLDARRTLVRSSNIGAAKVAEPGTEPVRRLLEKLQWNRALWPGGEPSRVPAPSEWSGGKGLLLAAGLGGLRATPLHLASSYAAIASGGRFVPPSTRGDGAATRVLSERTAAQLRDMLEAAVQEGSGQGARLPGLRAAGKTGTARSSADPERVWGHFVGFAPAEAPRWVVCVSAEVPGGTYAGGAVAAPAFARVVEALSGAAPRAGAEEQRAP